MLPINKQYPTLITLEVLRDGVHLGPVLAIRGVPPPLSMLQLLFQDIYETGAN